MRGDGLGAVVIVILVVGVVGGFLTPVPEAAEWTL
jgi:hypothetical protein